MASFPTRKLLPLLIAALTSATAGAVSLGDIELHSALGKPLDAVIPLNHLGDLDTQQLRVSLGSQDDYQAMGVEFTYQHTLIKLTPIVQDGRGFIRVVTRDPVAEPYLNFVLNLRWPQGQVVREYAVLLDPPTDSRVATVKPLVPVSPSEDSLEAAPVVAAQPVVAASRPQKAVREVAAPVDGSYRVQPGDSLWRLAARWRPHGVGVEQMMSAIHSANPDAFVANDPSRLKAMAELAVPNAEQIAAAGSLPTPAAPPQQLAEQPQPSTPVPAAPEPTGTIAGPRDEELVAENAALKTQVTELSDNVAALTTNLEASQGRLHEMEQKLGALVDQLERQRVTTQELATAAGVAPPRSESLVNDARAGDLLRAPEPHTPWWVHATYWIAIAALGAWVAFTQLWPRRRVAVVAADPARDEIETSLVAKGVPANNRWDTPDEKENYWHHRDSVADLPLDLVTPEPAAVAPAAPKSERPTFADITVTRTSEDTVDATISAGVFSAFGRYDEAEQVLIEALQREPQRVDLQLQLLDIYKHQDNRAAFIALADTIAHDHADDAATLNELAEIRRAYLG